jgi:uncharacterized protein YggU (UPF0235/DUF167 family)
MLIKVRVIPEAKKEMLVVVNDNTYVVHVTVKKEGGLANKAMLAALCAHFGTKHIRITGGHQRQHKIVEVHTLS